MDLTFQPTAQHNADTYRQHDPALWAEIRRVLAAIRDQEPRAKQTRLSLFEGTAWMVDVTVDGRDDLYQVIWVPVRDGAAADVVHLGPRLG